MAFTIHRTLLRPVPPHSYSERVNVKLFLTFTIVDITGRIIYNCMQVDCVDEWPCRFVSADGGPGMLNNVA